MPPRSLLLLACLAVPAASALAQSRPDSAAGSRRERIAPWRFELTPRIRVNPHLEPWAFRMREEALRFRADELRWRALERGRAARERNRDLLGRRLHERMYARRDLAMRRLDERLRSLHDRRWEMEDRLRHRLEERLRDRDFRPLRERSRYRPI